MADQLTITYVGGPTALLDFGGARLLTDPTFDPAGGEYPSGAAKLHKLAGPAVAASEIGPIDVVLLSHDHHADNLDAAGRALLPRARQVLTTPAGAGRLGGNAVGLEPWQELELAGPGGRVLHVLATPARHGPADLHRGPVTGFALRYADTPDFVVYVAGDTVWYEGVEEVARRLPVRVAVLNVGAARVAEVGPFHLTLTAAEAVSAARACPQALVVPLHFEGWAHFSEGRRELEDAFAQAGLTDRLRWLTPGRALRIA